jgi:hypothetical protein
MRRGVELEPVARALYEVETGLIVEPALVVHREHEWLRASLDGITIDGELPIEIKVPGRRAHHDALEGRVPDYYWPQCAHILLVTGAERLDYVSFDGTDIVIVPVERDAAYESELLDAEREFWRCVINRTSPAERVYEGHIEVTMPDALAAAVEYESSAFHLKRRDGDMTRPSCAIAVLYRRRQSDWLGHRHPAAWSCDAGPEGVAAKRH